jgi:hypothetical protein
VDLPALVPEVTLDLTADARLRVGGEAVADLGVVVVYRLEQADVSDLHEIFYGFWAAAVLPDAGPDQLVVPVHEYLAGRGAQLAIPGQRADLSEQGVVGQLFQLRTRPWVDGGITGVGGGVDCRRLAEGSPRQRGLPETLGITDE